MVMERPKGMPAEDFSEYASRVPGFFFFLGVTPEDKSKVAPNHSPRFMVNEAGMESGIRAMTYVTLDYLNGK
jgi:amidohydrolase